MPAAIAALEQAVAAEAARAGRADATAEGDRRRRASVGLRQRVWPLVEMMKRAQAAGEPIVWGV